jgi:hypothetical protein
MGSSRTVQQLVDDLASGRINLDLAVRDFGTRRWPGPAPETAQQRHGVHDADLPDPNSIDWVQVSPGLSDEQRRALLRVYDQRTSRSGR